ncbi:hypothetical protein [Streptomyces sp. NPDC058701]|uniref:hypothetical protein n=1 Tax=Streptomyces sp. NPDC058701 TaxID=3346608 RepID=UPI00364AED33
MLNLELEPLLQLVEMSTRFERPWSQERISFELVQVGWEPVGSVSLPYPQRLGRSGFLLGAACDDEPAYVGVTLKEWSVDWDSVDYVRAVTEGYEDQIRATRELADRFAALMGERFSVDREELILDADEFFFVHTECWKVSNVHVVLGLEHLSPDDTPIRVSLYVVDGSADRPGSLAPDTSRAS